MSIHERAGFVTATATAGARTSFSLSRSECGCFS